MTASAEAKGVGAEPPAQPTPVAALAPARQATNTPALLAGLAWIASAALTGYFALLQLGYANLVPELGSLAVWNGIAAAVTLSGTDPRGGLIPRRTRRREDRTATLFVVAWRPFKWVS
jgi:hypothetical protein